MLWLPLLFLSILHPKHLFLFAFTVCSYTWKLYSVSFFIKNFFICSYCACSSFAVVYLQKQPTSSVLWKICFENFAKFTEKHLPRCLIFNKVGGLARNFKKKKIQALVSYCEFFKIIRNIWFVEKVRTAASKTPFGICIV